MVRPVEVLYTICHNYLVFLIQQPYGEFSWGTVCLHLSPFSGFPHSAAIWWVQLKYCIPSSVTILWFSSLSNHMVSSAEVLYAFICHNSLVFLIQQPYGEFIWDTVCLHLSQFSGFPHSATIWWGKLRYCIPSSITILVFLIQQPYGEFSWGTVCLHLSPFSVFPDSAAIWWVQLKYCIPLSVHNSLVFPLSSHMVSSAEVLYTFICHHSLIFLIQQPYGEFSWGTVYLHLSQFSGFPHSAAIWWVQLRYCMPSPVTILWFSWFSSHMVSSAEVLYTFICHNSLVFLTQQPYGEFSWGTGTVYLHLSPFSGFPHSATIWWVQLRYCIPSSVTILWFSWFSSHVVRSAEVLYTFICHNSLVFLIQLPYGEFSWGTVSLHLSQFFGFPHSAAIWWVQLRYCIPSSVTILWFSSLSSHMVRPVEVLYTFICHHSLVFLIQQPYGKFSWGTVYICHNSLVFLIQQPYGEFSWGTVWLHLLQFSGFPHSATIWWVQLRYCMPSSVTILWFSWCSSHMVSSAEVLYTFICHNSLVFLSAAIWWVQLRYCIPSSVHNSLVFPHSASHMVSLAEVLYTFICHNSLVLLIQQPYGEFSWGTVCLHLSQFSGFPDSAAIWWGQLRYCIPSSVHHSLVFPLSSHMVSSAEVLYAFICHNSLVFLIQLPYGEVSWGTVCLHLSQFSGFPHSATIWWVQLRYCIPSSVTILWFSSLSSHMVRPVEVLYTFICHNSLVVLIQQPYGEFSWGTVYLHLSQFSDFPHSATIWWVQLRYCMASSVTILWFSSFSNHMVSSAEVLYSFICHHSLIFLAQQPYGEVSWGTVYLHLSPFSGFPHSATIWWVQLRYCIPSSVTILWFSSLSSHMVRSAKILYTYICYHSLVFFIQQPYGEFSWSTVYLHLSQFSGFPLSSHMMSFSWGTVYLHLSSFSDFPHSATIWWVQMRYCMPSSVTILWFSSFSSHMVSSAEVQVLYTFICHHSLVFLIQQPYGEFSWGTVYLYLSQFSGCPHSAAIWWVQLRYRYCIPSSVTILWFSSFSSHMVSSAEVLYTFICHNSLVVLIQQPYGEFSWGTVYLYLSQFSGFPHSATIWWVQLRYCIPSSVTIPWFSSFSSHIVSST